MGYRFVRMIGSGLAEVTNPQGRTIRVAVPPSSNFRSGQEVTPTFDKCCCPTGLVVPTPSSSLFKPFKDVLQPRRVSTNQVKPSLPVKPILIQAFREISTENLSLDEAEKKEPLIKLYNYFYVDRDYCPKVYKDGYLVGTYIKVISTTEQGKVTIDYQLIKYDPLYHPLPNKLFYLETGSFGTAYGKRGVFAWEPPSILELYDDNSNIYLTPEGYILNEDSDGLFSFMDEQGKVQMYESTPITLVDFADDTKLSNNTFLGETLIIDTQGFDPNNILDAEVENLKASEVISVMAPSKYLFKSPTTEPISAFDAIFSYDTLTYDPV